ncbi:MAG: GntR family transcriptional regulator [Verrucomicrobia bacterium]|nr:GntR family transcriptional regulator [Verrucomicrobiota bacterium]
MNKPHRIVPKYLRVKHALHGRILRGESPPKSQLPSERELMRAFRVSQQTVIRALHELRLEGLVTRHQGKGTFVSDASPGRNQIGILTYLDETLPTVSVYPQNLLRSQLNHLRRLGEQPRLYSTFGTDRIGDVRQHAREVLEDCARSRLRCLIVAASYNASQAENALKRWGIHVIGSHREEAISACNVAPDSGAMAETGLRHLLSLGFRKPAILASRPTYAAMDKQVKAYLHLMEQQRIAVRPGWFRSEEFASDAAGYQQFQRLWAMDDRPEAILITDDIMAQGATRAMMDLGIRVPRDLTVMVEMNRWSCLVYPAPVIALEIDFDPVGLAAAELAVRLARDEPVETLHCWIKPKIRIYEMADPGAALATQPASQEPSNASGTHESPAWATDSASDSSWNDPGT